MNLRWESSYVTRTRIIIHQSPFWNNVICEEFVRQGTLNNKVDLDRYDYEIGMYFEPYLTYEIFNVELQDSCGNQLLYLKSV
jgi:hypothetical protein